ncbi:exodeoxyribonuclease VII large subunit [Aminicella lysinilytica]|uniref:Exodeoxyribonuclease 7 large subunit n=1 Tax=Aminicella lysinilytica TaxID=433323 RepID=A0A4R6Q7N1_9FIRM|nr:exodeoxyribonuclease VII large subunit [Aminicella lysinilytica]TDP58528.1 exodeoxyribonuclease VII large subunit [Aminicella lysinilytica]
MAIKPISVTQLNEYISRVLSTDPLLTNVTVHGEASGVKYHSNGFIYFSLVDQSAKVNCALPGEYARDLKYELQDGMDLNINGSLRLYKKNGSYSIFVRNVEICGEGSLAIAFEQMKNKLQNEGLFDKSHKKQLPAFPYKVGVITSATGAAVRDILKIIKSRNNVVDIVVFPVLVQGDGAAPQISHAIDIANEKFDDIDVLIVGRGGGAAEDLWAFNEEIVAHSIYDSRIPVISAVGHEIDFTISDMVADVRAETPTAAAQIAVPDTTELQNNIDDMKRQMSLELNNRVMFNAMKVENMMKDIRDSFNNRIEMARNQVGSLKMLLTENDPRRILENGYSIVESSGGKVITDAKAIDKSDKFKLIFHKGWAYCTIIETGSDKDGD